jgi:azurin
MKPIPSILRLTAVFTALILISGCGRSKQEAGSPAPAQPAARAVPAEGRAIEITGNDSMKFNVTEIRVKAGEALAVTLKNVGTMPKFSMGHNWVLVENGVKLADFTSDAAQAVKTDYVPDAYKAKIIAATKLLGPNESDTVLFYAPKKVGRYDFLCTFPGHFQVGMKGVLIVD